jgi:hypothetical protein
MSRRRNDELKQKLASELRQLAQDANAEYLEHRGAAPEQTRIELLDALARDFEASVSAKEAR